MPVVFKDFGKGAKDILSKKYDYKNEVKVTNKADGLTIEATGCEGKSGLAGCAKVTYNDKSFGEFESNFASCGGYNGKVKMTSLVDATTITVSTDSALKSKLEVDYKLDALTLQCDVNSCLKSNVQASADVIDGLVAGCKAELDFSNGADLKDYNIGLQYGYSSDVTLACVTSKGRSMANLSACQKLSASDSYAIGYNMCLASYVGHLTVGMEKKLDSATTVKAKIDSCGVLATAVEHKLSDPNVKVNVAAQFDATSPDLTTQKFGLGLALGDY